MPLLAKQNNMLHSYQHPQMFKYGEDLNFSNKASVPETFLFRSIEVRLYSKQNFFLNHHSPPLKAKQNSLHLSFVWRRSILIVLYIFSFYFKQLVIKKLVLLFLYKLVNNVNKRFAEFVQRQLTLHSLRNDLKCESCSRKRRKLNTVTVWNKSKRKCKLWLLSLCTPYERPQCHPKSFSSSKEKVCARSVGEQKLWPSKSTFHQQQQNHMVKPKGNAF